MNTMVVIGYEYLNYEHSHSIITTVCPILVPIIVDVDLTGVYIGGGFASPSDVKVADLRMRFCSVFPDRRLFLLFNIRKNRVHPSV